MTVHDNFQSFWDELQKAQPNKHGFHDWQFAQILHTNDADYAIQVANNSDELGFQPLSVTMVNPLTKEAERVVVKNVDDKLANEFRDYARKHLYGSLAQRFGSFRPDETKAFTAYDDWDSFYKTWLERDNESVMHLNVPLIFDHTPKIEYWTRKQTGQTILPYQRLLVTTYFVHENRFYDFFIKNVDDEQAEQIKLLMQSRLGLNLNSLFEPRGKKTHAT